MQEGLSATVEEPVIEPIPAQPQLTYDLRPALMKDNEPIAVFASQADVDAFNKIALIPVNYNWFNNRASYYVDEDGTTKTHASNYQFYVLHEMTRKRTEITEYEEARNRNKSRLGEYEKAKDKIDKIQRKVADAISDAECESDNARRVLAKFAEFVGLSNGVPAIALNFILKSHDAESLQAACKFVMSHPDAATKDIESATLLSNLINAQTEQKEAA